MNDNCITLDPEFGEWCEPKPSEFRWDAKHASQSVDRRLVAEIEAMQKARVEAVVVLDAGEALAQRFREQADRWATETQHLSSPTQMMMHPSYQAILGMAHDDKDRVVNLMLRDLKEKRRPWFWALSYLTHENPIRQSDAGRLNKMIEAWVEWGKKRGRL